MKTRILTILALVVLGSRPALIHAQAYSEFSVDSMFSVLVTGCPSGTENIPVVNATYENKVIELLNIERISKSLPPLKKADELSRSARYHAWEMCKYQYFNHNSMDSLRKNIICTPANRVMPFYNFIAFAENIAEGQPTPEIVNTNWINSSGHYQNMISPNYWEIGVGYIGCPADTYKTRWDENFGQRVNVYPIIINNEAASTNSLYVDLYIYGNGPYTQMRLHNDGESWGNWQAIQTNVKNWKLRNAIGTRTVYMEIKNSLGTVRSSQDNIEYLGPAAIDSRQAIAGLEVNLYPNPATKNSVIMIYSDTKRKLSVGLYDLYGKKIVSIFSGETSAMSPLTFNWPEFVNTNGIYLLKTEYEGYTLVTKVILNN